jgi:hypothetical protein
MSITQRCHVCKGLKLKPKVMYIEGYYGGLLLGFVQQLNEHQENQKLEIRCSILSTQNYCIYIEGR